MVYQDPVLIVLLRLLFHEKSVPLAKIIFTGALCTALTLPYLWFVLPAGAAYYPLIGELLVVHVETAILDRVPGPDVKTTEVCSFSMNGTSFFIRYILM
jgi:hypothetical protein